MRTPVSPSSHVPPDVLAMARRARRVVVLTGAGMSAESGLPTFRDAQTGLWARYEPEDLASLDAWNRDPEFVWAWYRWRAATVRQAEPNAGHRALAAWDDRGSAEIWIVTQNVDDLHERAGSGVLAHLHGSIFALRCSACGLDAEDTQPLPREPVERLAPPRCATCGALVRPGIVWFGEPLPMQAFAHAQAAVASADLVLVVGTSGLVHPAAGLPLLALQHEIPVVEINPEPTELSEAATSAWRAPAAVALPALVGALGAQP